MTVRERFNEIVRFVASVLTPLSFRRQRQCFHRNLPQLWHVVRLTRSPWNDASECKFWIEFGVYVPKVFALIHPDLKEPACPDAMNLTVRWDAGWQHPPFLQKSWRILATDTLPDADLAIQESLSVELREYVLPFLERFRVRRDVIEFLEWLREHRAEVPGGFHIGPSNVWLTVYLAVLYWLEGDWKACCRELEVAVQNGWMYERVVQLWERLVNARA